MEQDSDNIITKQLDKLSEPLKSFIISDDFVSILNNIGEKYNLDNENQIILENETVMIFLGLESIADFENNLISNTKLDSELTHKIASEVSEKVIAPIETDLREFLEKELKDEEQRISSEESDTNTEDIKKVLRENSKTVNVKDLISNLN